jgi:signal transduction histidine kinase
VECAVNPTLSGTGKPQNAVMTRAGRGIALTLTAVGALSVAGLLALVVRTGNTEPLLPSALAAAFLVAGAIGARARPDHRGLQLLLAVGATHLGAYALTGWVGAVDSPAGWAPWLLAVVGDGLYLAGFVALALLVATYPTGRLSSRGLRWFAVVCLGFATVALLAEALLHARLGLALETGLAAVPAPPPLPLADAGPSLVGAMPALVVAGVVVLVVRARRFTGDERGALGWASLAGGVLALMLAATPLAAVVLPDTVWTVAFVTVVSAVPFVLLGGLVRFRLLQVDLYLVRTVGRGAVALVVLAAYAGATALLGEAGFVAAAVGLTVLAALTGGAVLRRVESLADRWLTGGRVARRGLLDAFVAALPGASDDLAERIRRMLTEGLDIAWTRVVVHGEVRAGGSGVAEVVVPLRVGTTDVGALECGPRRGGWGRSELARLESLATPAALALHERELTRELAERVEELTASRARLVQVEQSVRRQVERDLHDGAQQLLVALLARLAIARASVTDASTAEALETAHDLAGRCLRDLRALVAGLHPALLGDKGLTAAVGARADLLPIAVTVDADPRVADDRFPAEVESAAFFVVCEALANVLKHSGSSVARVVLSPLPPHGLRVAISDEGSGAADLTGSGLPGLRDRVEALGGSFRLVAVLDVGTTVVAEFPVDRAAVLHG